MSFRITYTTATSNMDEIHRLFESSLDSVSSQFGDDHQANIGYVSGGEANEWIENHNPSRLTQVLGRFATTSKDDLSKVLDLARAAAHKWGNCPWQERVATMRRAADLINERKFNFAAIVSLEVGKNRLEALGDVEESADLLRYYASEIEDHIGYSKPLSRLHPQEETLSIFRPYGVFAVIAPFNFPAALAAGMSGAAMVAGNAVVLKPSEETPWSGKFLLEIMRDAGVPEGVFQVVQGTGSSIGSALVQDQRIDGVVFTGSRKVGHEIQRIMSSGKWIKPCLLELGGKNGTIVSESADIETAVSGCIRSAFGLSGQKCSALSRILLHKDIEKKFMESFLSRVSALTVGSAEARDTFVGPVINRASVERHRHALAAAQSRGIVSYVRDMKSVRCASEGHFVSPVVAELNSTDSLMQEELFLPFVGISSFVRFNDAMNELNGTQYGLTAGIYSLNESEVTGFFENAEAGVLYANRASGATTGAWPGVQSFCGWKASGFGGKGGCGPYYAAQFMREQSRTRMRSDR